MSGAERFDGLAESCERRRPGYPPEVFRALTADLRCAA